MNSSHTQFIKQGTPDSRLHIVHDPPEKTKLWGKKVSGGWGLGQGERVNHRGQEGTFWGDGALLYLACDGAIRLGFC